MAKKTNYISIELEKFERHVKELQDYLDENSPSTIEDRKEVVPGRGDNPSTTKIVVTKEAQIKSYRDSLKEIPALLSALNTLRKEVEGAKDDIAVRGGQDTPGFMDDEDDEDDSPATPPPIVKPSLDKPVQKSKSKLAGDDDDDDDDEVVIPKPKKITPPPTQWETDEEFDED